MSTCAIMNDKDDYVMSVYINQIIMYGFCRMADERQTAQARARASFADTVLVLCFVRSSQEEWICYHLSDRHSFDW